MRFLADECIAVTLVAQLRDAGHDVRHVGEEHRGIDDRAVLALAQKESRILLTEDKDFGDYAFRQRLPVPGLVLIRPQGMQRAAVWPRLQAAIQRFGDDLLGRYTVVEAGRFRARPMPRRSG